MRGDGIFPSTIPEASEIPARRGGARSGQTMSYLSIVPLATSSRVARRHAICTSRGGY